jgi:hypothetical protein
MQLLGGADKFMHAASFQLLLLRGLIAKFGSPAPRPRRSVLWRNCARVTLSGALFGRRDGPSAMCCTLLGTTPFEKVGANYTFGLFL